MAKKGYPWSVEEKEKLRKQYRVSISIDTLADSLDRSKTEILACLLKLQIPPLRTYLFVLALRDDRFFVGHTFKPDQLVTEYIKERKAGQNPWLDLYPVIGKLEMVEMTNYFELDQKVKYYMYYKGLNRVRGGSYSSVNLSNAQIVSLQAELSFIYQHDQCFLST